MKAMYIERQRVKHLNRKLECIGLRNGNLDAKV